MLTPDRPHVLRSLDNRDLYDPLAEITRVERKNLLLVSLVCLALTWSGLLPTRIEALGITIEGSNRKNLIVLLGLTLTYFLLAFVIYAATDFMRWRVAKILAQHDAADPALTPPNSDIELGRAAFRRIGLRAAFELVVPLVAAAVAALSVLAQLLDLNDPVTLISIVWIASPAACVLIVASLLWLTWIISYRSSLVLREDVKHYCWMMGSWLFQFGVKKKLQAIQHLGHWVMGIGRKPL